MQCGCITAYVLKYYVAPNFFCRRRTTLDDITGRAFGAGRFPDTLFGRILVPILNPFFVFLPPK